MPYINIRNAGPLSKDQKEEISSKVTSIIAEVTQKPASSVSVVIEEVPRENWSIGGTSLAEQDKNK